MVADSQLEDALTRALAKTPGLVSAYLFGSVATGRAHRESDVDVGVVVDWAAYPTPVLRFDLRLVLLTRLTSAAGRDVDLVVLNDAPPQFARRVMTEGRALLVIDAEQNHAHLRTTLSRAADIEPFLRRTRATKLKGLAR